MRFKEYINEKIGAILYESAIVMVWNDSQDLKISYEDAGIKSATANEVIKNKSLMDSMLNVVTFLEKTHPSLKNTSAKMITTKNGITPFWASYTGSNKKATAKTDFIIGDYRISLKVGSGQIMSGAKSESLATFHAAAIGMTSITKTSEFQDVQETIDGFIKTRIIGTIGGKEGALKNNTYPIIMKTDKLHKSLNEKVKKLFSASDEFKMEFAREAMSGAFKFGKDSIATSEYILVISNDAQKIKMNSIKNDSYCLEVANKMKIVTRFKSASVKNSSPKQYNVFSALSIVYDSFKESIISDFTNTIKNTISKLINSITDGISFLNIFKTEPESIKFNNNINF